MNRVYYPKAIAVLNVLLFDYGDTKKKQEFHLSVAPTRVSININSYTEADTFSMSSRFEDLPFDPRLVRAIQVTIGVIDLKSLRKFDLKDFNKNHDSVIFTGFADRHTIKWDESERIVSFEGRDFTSYFIDTPYRGKKPAINRPVKDVIQDLIKQIPGAENIKVEDRSGSAIKSVAKSLPGWDLVNGKKSTDGQFEYTSPNRTYWDVIVSLCESAALICYIELDKLVLTSPRILYSSSNKKRSISLIYGENLSDLSFYRNLGRKKKFNLILRSFDVHSQKNIEVLIPRDSEKSWSRAMNINKNHQMVRFLDSNGVAQAKPAPFYSFSFKSKSKDELIQIGQKTFEEFVRQQLEGECATREMRINDETGAEFDLSKIKVGTPVALEIRQEDVKYILRQGPDGRQISSGQRISYLIRRGWKREAAQTLIDAVGDGLGRLRPLFYTREAQIEMNEDGFSIRIGFVNFIQISDNEDGSLKSG